MIATSILLNSNEAVEDWKNEMGEGGIGANTVYRSGLIVMTMALMAMMTMAMMMILGVGI